ncbi:helix-turn-helix domain-containing protein [uncultured Fructobacillus sp.]|uniref:helix-turn-helix domain-containing protein n=1 Tax=uncultured Fructobacillus sp. TaxID=591942 RepID=UPI0025977DC1|nr:helix-turn-helix transcriptional regulator [uncultured Fructobacillus sp.]
MLNRIKELRLEHNLTLKELSEKTGISDVNLSRYERGIVSPRPNMWRKLADFFNVPLGYLQGTNDIKDKFWFDGYDFNQSWMKSDKAREAVKNSLGIEYDSPEQYEYDEKMGLNDIYINQFHMIKKMFFYGDDSYNGLLNKKTIVSLVKAINLVFTNALEIEEDIRDYDVEEPTSYINQEVNKYVDLIKKYNPRWTNYSELNIALTNDKNVFYKKKELSDNQVEELKALLSKFEQQNKKASDD